MGGDAIAAQIQQLLGIGFHETAKRRLGDAGAGLLPRPLRLRAVGDARRRGDRPARRRQARRDRRGGARHDGRRSTFPRDSGALALGADKVAKAIADARSPRAASMPRSSATARAALYWLEPMVEVETPQGRVAYGPVTAERCRRRCSTPASSPAATHRAVARADRRNPVPGQADAADLRALRHHRSAVARRLSRRMAA